MKLMAAVDDPLHTFWSIGLLTVGVGFTVMVNVCVAPLQMDVFVNTGVTMRVAITGVDPVLVAVKVPMLPLPLAKMPMVALSFVHV